MTRLPDIPVRIDLPPPHRAAAWYALTMLGLISGFRAVSARPEDEGREIVYGPGGTLACSESAWEAMGAGRCIEGPMIRTIEHGTSIAGMFQAPDGRIDLVASTFFLLSLYEEWSSDVRDAFGRFPAEASVLHREGLIDRPLVAEYATVCTALLQTAGWSIPERPRFAGKSSAVCLTHDVDYLRKFTPGLVYREAFTYLLRNGLQQTPARRLRRFREYLGFLPPSRDPYRVSLHRLLDRERRYGIHATWFFKTGGADKRDAPYDLNGRFLREAFSRVCAEGHELGLHPSFRVFEDGERIAMEKDELERSAGVPVRSVRQHYLRFRHPQTWRAQAAAGLTLDSTIGFAAREGFRAGSCHPFLAWDHENREALPVFEVPLHIMDGTLAFYRSLEADASELAVRGLFDTVRMHRGIAVLLLHNVVDDAHDFPGWSGVADRLCADIGGRGDTLPGTLSSTLAAWLEGSGWSGPEEIARDLKKKCVEP